MKNILEKALSELKDFKKIIPKDWKPSLNPFCDTLLIEDFGDYKFTLTPEKDCDQNGDLIFNGLSQLEFWDELDPEVWLMLKVFGEGDTLGESVESCIEILETKINGESLVKIFVDKIKDLKPLTYEEREDLMHRTFEEPGPTTYVEMYGDIVIEVEYVDYDQYCDDTTGVMVGVSLYYKGSRVLSAGWQQGEFNEVLLDNIKKRVNKVLT